MARQNVKAFARRGRRRDFTKEKNVTHALSSLADIMNSYSSTFVSDDDLIVATAMIEGVRDTLGSTYHKVKVNGKTKSVYDGDVFDKVFKTETAKTAEGVEYTRYSLASGDALQKYVDSIVKESSKKNTKVVIDHSRKVDKNGDPYTKTVESESKLESAYYHIPTLDFMRKSVEDSIKASAPAGKKTVSSDQITQAMIKRAEKSQGVGVSDIDQAFQFVSTGIKNGTLAGLEGLVWLDGRQATYADVEAILAAAGKI